MPLVVTSLRECDEDTDGNSSDYKRTEDGLKKDGVLDLPQSRFLDPHFPIQDFAENVAFLVLGNPWFVFIAVAATESVEGTLAEFEAGGRVVVLRKELPRSEMTMVHAMEDLTLSDDVQE